jgi:hypothetical protein
MDISHTIVPKSDQLNADDLIGGARTIKVRDVKGADDAQQPLAVYYEGDNNKPYKPCLSMRRVLAKVWGLDAANWVGRQMVLYRDDSVVFGGIKVGGIRISHVSDIDSAVTLALSESRAKRKPFIVQPLVVQPKVKVELTPEHDKWQGAKEAIKAGTTTLEKIKAHYELSIENEKLLTDENDNNTAV